jgi:hypothetical protein
VNARIVGDIVGQKRRHLAGRDAPDFVTAKRHAPVAGAIQMRVTAGTGQQVQAPVSIAADMRAFGGLGVRASRCAQIPGADQPDAGEISGKNIHDAVRNAPEFFLECARVVQRRLQLIDLDEPFFHSPVPRDARLAGRHTVNLIPSLRRWRRRLFRAKFFARPRQFGGIQMGIGGFKHRIPFDFVIFPSRTAGKPPL